MNNIRKGDKVVKNDNYYVSESEKGTVFTVRSDPFDICGTVCVLLEGVSGGYALDGLTKVKFDEFDENSLMPCPFCGGEAELIIKDGGSKEKQIEEMACDMGCLLGCNESRDCSEIFARNLYNAGYRKATEVAREIVEIAKDGAEKYINDITLHEGIRNMLSVMLDDFVAALKKKYTEGVE